MTDFSPLQAQFPDQFRPNDPLARYTVARLGGPAAAVLIVKARDELIWAVQWAASENVAWFILGGGANVLASDEGYDGLVIVNHARATDINAETGIVTVESGVNLPRLTRQCMAAGLKGLEWGISVPGTVGGAVVNNAGAHGGDMAGNLHEAELLHIATGNVETWPTAKFAYDYRYSLLKEQHSHVVLQATLALEPGYAPPELNAMAEEFLAHRKRTQPPGASLGSMFKNPPGDYAGRLIEAAGLKGQQVGQVHISPIHANFFVNLGGGTASDYRALIQLAQDRVWEQFGVRLELEIELVAD